MSTKILGIDVGSVQICTIIAQVDGNDVKILGTGSAKSTGVRKGAISNIEQASKSIRSALLDAQRVAGTHFEKVIVSINGSYIKSVDSSGVVNIPNHDIGIRELNRAMQMADHNANIPHEYEKLHILPYNFKVDGQDNIDDPLGMSGNRLEVQAHIIIVQKTAFENLKKTVRLAGAEVDNIVLSGYASSIATINNDERELGVAVIDMGGATCDFVIHSGNSIIFNEFLGVGSANITNDLSSALHTTLITAEAVKIEYGSLHHNSGETIELQNANSQGETHDVSLDIVSNVIYARVEETLIILANMLENSGLKNHIGGGVVLTGGMTKLGGLRDLASAVFDNISIRLAKPKDMDGLFESIKDPEYSTCIGLVLYGAGHFTPYEIDSNNNMRYKDEIINKKNVNKEEENHNLSLNINHEDNNLSKDDKLDNFEKMVKEEKKESALSQIWHKITQLF